MGLGSSLKKIVKGDVASSFFGVSGAGLLNQGDKPFRTGASKARKNAEKLAKEGMALSREIFDTAKPGVLQGIDANKMMLDYSSPEGMAELYGDVFSSLDSGPLADNVINPLIEERMRGSKQALSAAGLRRSGAAAREAANIPTGVKTSVADGIIGRILTGLGNTSQMGASFMGGSNSALQGFMNSGQMGVNAQLGGASQQANTLGGLASLAASLFAAFSDPALKTNVRKIDEIAGLDVCRWDWVPGAEERLGDMANINEGFMADQVKEKYPQHVYTVNVDGNDLMIIDYNALAQEIAA